MFSSYFLSFLAMLCFGVAWFLAAVSSKKLGAFKSLFLFQLVGIPFFVFLIPFASFNFSINSLYGVLALGLYEALIMMVIFHATEIGTVSVVGPIIDSYGLFALPLGILFLNEQITLFKTLAAFLIFIGVVLLSLNTYKKSLNVHKGVLPALIGAFGTAIYFIFVGVLARQVGWFINALVIRIGISIVLFFVLIFRKTDFKKLFSNNIWKILIPAALLDVIGFSLFNVSVLQSKISYATVIISAQSFIIVLLSWWFLKERLKIYQIIGLFAVVLGLVILSL